MTVPPELRLSVPSDTSIVGFDDQELIAESVHPAVTTGTLPHYEMGAWAVETHVKRLDTAEGEDPSRPYRHGLPRHPTRLRHSPTAFLTNLDPAYEPSGEKFWR